MPPALSSDVLTPRQLAFIAGLAFGEETLRSEAKIGILVAAIIAGLGGWLVLSRSGRPREK